MGIFDSFNPSGQGTMFGSNQNNSSTSFYDYLGKKRGLTEEGMFDLTGGEGGLGNKEKAPKLIKEFFEYIGEKPEQTKVDQMMSNPGFIMGLSLMQQASAGKNFGGALMPAAETTQGFIANQELRAQNKRLMRSKETDQIVEFIKTTSDLQTAETGRDLTKASTAGVKMDTAKTKEQITGVKLDNISTIVNNIDGGMLKNQTRAIQNNQANFDLSNSKDNLQYTKEFVATFDNMSKEYRNAVIANPALMGQLVNDNEISNYLGDYEQVKSTKGIELLSSLGVSTQDQIQGERIIDDQVISIAVQAANLEQRQPNQQDFLNAEKLVFEGMGISQNNVFTQFFTGKQYSFSKASITDVLKGNRMGGEVFEGVPTIIGEDGPEVFVPETDGNIISNPKTASGYTWEDAIIDSSEMLKKIKQSSGAQEAKKALKKFRPDLYI
tara:strand:+ start:6197 stop:7510 length:1314 start_codon:yes stop_codon:yes gene_type:complete